MLSRRQVLALGAGALGVPGALVSGRAQAAGTPQRCFLFLHCDGGWDTSFVFTPELLGKVDHQADAQAGNIGGVDFLDHPERGSVRDFLSQHAGQTAIINGMEVRSITHERCRRIVLTGQGEGAVDDWPSILAASSPKPLLLPHLVLAGHAFNAQHADQVVRVGDDGQLAKLLDGSAFAERDQGMIVPPAPEIEQDLLKARLASLQTNAGSTAEADYYARYAQALSAADTLRGVEGLSLAPQNTACERDMLADAATLFECFSRGLSRCGMLKYEGWCGEGWDSHENVANQARHFSDLFGYLSGILADLETRVAVDGSPLRDHVTVVLFSEMGRTPSLNALGGKDHWTFTSAMLVGAGVQGGQTVGALSDQSRGLPIDLETGSAMEGGVSLTASNLGATLLAMGDVDPGGYTDAQPLQVVMR